MAEMNTCGFRVGLTPHDVSRLEQGPRNPRPMESSGPRNKNGTSRADERHLSFPEESTYGECSRWGRVWNWEQGTPIHLYFPADFVPDPPRHPTRILRLCSRTSESAGLAFPEAEEKGLGLRGSCCIHFSEA